MRKENAKCFLKDPECQIREPRLSVASVVVNDNACIPERPENEIILPDYLRAYKLCMVVKEASATKTNQNKEDWQATARVMDRLFIIMFLVVMMIATVVIYCKYRNNPYRVWNLGLQKRHSQITEQVTGNHAQFNGRYGFQRRKSVWERGFVTISLPNGMKHALIYNFYKYCWRHFVSDEMSVP